MITFFQQLVARPLIGWWLTTSAQSWHRVLVAHDSPHVHAPGINPDRVLVAGDGAATGRGVITHDLGLPGYLARSLSARTGHATDVDIVVDGNMTARSCLLALNHVDLGLFDIVLLSLGINEALALTSKTIWSQAMFALLDELENELPVATQIFLLPIPAVSINPHFPPRLGRVVDRHALVLNGITNDLAQHRPRVQVLPGMTPAEFKKEGPHVYQRWAETMATDIGGALDPDRVRVGESPTVDDVERQAALAGLSLRGTNLDPILEAFAEKARRTFGTAIAAVTFIEAEVQIMETVVGMDPMVIPRQESFCDITIRRARHFVIEDARRDMRYENYGVVKGDPRVRFYAGYPIEAPDGTRIGALCVMDPQPRNMDAGDTEILRTLAQKIQHHIWQTSSP